MKVMWVVAVASACVLGWFASSAAAAKPTACTVGNAQSMFQAPIGRIIGNPCQYRLFWDGQTRTFCEGDVILGGVVLMDPYKADGISRKDVIASIQQTHDRVWIDGVERPLMSTAVKDALSPNGDLIAYQQRGFIAQLSVGTHVSYWEETDAVNGLSTATVTLDVLPQSDPACS